MGWLDKLLIGSGGGEPTHDYAAELEQLRSRKREDSYHFSYDFTYIAKNLGNDEYEDGIATMECDVVWDDVDAGYRVSYYVPEMHLIDPAEGNGGADDFYEYVVYWKLIADLNALGIDSSLRLDG